MAMLKYYLKILSTKVLYTVIIHFSRRFMAQYITLLLLDTVVTAVCGYTYTRAQLLGANNVIFSTIAVS